MELVASLVLFIAMAVIWAAMPSGGVAHEDLQFQPDEQQAA